MVDWLLSLAAGYAGVGAAIGAAFVLFGAGRVDPAARGASWGVRLLLWPGAAALWPWIIARWLGAGRRDSA